MAEPAVLNGGCACGAVRFTARGAPTRTGLCHCLTCRKSTGSAFNAFVVFPARAVDMTGELRRWVTETGFELHSCPTCGSRVSGSYPEGDEEIELSLGAFDETGRFSPDYESWVFRREPWLSALAVPQNEHDPPGG